MATRLPGIYFETLVPPVTDALPRMDIAAFVGFAPCGPLDVPVPVEDAERFREIFGQDQLLAWDPIAGENVCAQLPPTFRSFFRNGGQRCWIVRVADDPDHPKATANEFMLPGTLLAGSNPSYDAAWLTARAKGSWSDDHAVNATLSYSPIACEAPQKSGTEISVLLYPNTVTSVSEGDLVRIAFDAPPGSPSQPNLLLFLPVNTVTATTQVTSPGPVQQIISVAAQQGFWFRVAVLEDFTLEASSPPDPTTNWFIPPQGVSWLTQPESVDLWIQRWGIERGSEPPLFVLDTLRSQVENLTPGSWLRVQPSSNDIPQGTTNLFLQVDSVRGSTVVAPGNSSSPSNQQETVQIVVKNAWWALDDQIGWTQDLSRPRADVVALELWVRDGNGMVTTISNLGLTPLHPHYIGYLPTDEQLYSQPDQPTTPLWCNLSSEVDHPRFPLAAPSVAISNDTLPTYLPLGVPGLVNADFYQPALPQTATALERDGLALDNGQLSSSLFLDPDLSSATVNTLLNEAFHKRYQLRRGGSQGPAGEPLLKLHAILPIEEVSLLALPDATHPGWQLAPLAAAGDLSAPTLLSISINSPADQITASWTQVADATSYTLQESTDPQFGSSTVAWEGAATADSLGNVQSAPFDQPSGCPTSTYFRVRAVKNGIIGPWSNALTRTLPLELFDRCVPNTLDPPVIEAPTESRGRLVLQWSVPQSNVDSFQLEIAYEPAFVLPEILFDGKDSYFEVWTDPSRTAYFRVASRRGSQSSPWSNTVVAQSDLNYQQYWMNPPAAPGTEDSSTSEQMRVHQAMIRLCAARADVFAILTLPRAFDAATCVLYTNQLAASLASENGDFALSFAAIYFPWLVTLDASDDQPGSIRTVSPEGALAGTIAGLTLSSGAWLSPGNQLLQAIVDVDAELGDEAPTQFFNNHLNLVVQEPSGFLTMSSFTLSSNSQLAEINVRRLLILLRRLALREGMIYVFQPNDPTFWRRVQRRFEDMLGNLFLQGAFAGATQGQSFQVRTDPSVTKAVIDQGQFIVEISIAPSLPLEFLTVRLLQQGGDLRLSEEF